MLCLLKIANYLTILTITIFGLKIFKAIKWVVNTVSVCPEGSVTKPSDRLNLKFEFKFPKFQVNFSKFQISA